MKLKELLLPAFDANIYENLPLQSNHLKLFGDTLLECEELKGVEIEFIEAPAFEINGKMHLAQTMMMGMDERHVNQLKKYKKIYLHSFILTPQMYDPTVITTPVKDGACIGPRQYNVTNFEPSVKVVLSYDPETCSIETEEGKNKLRELLEKVLTSPQEYTHQPQIGLMIRGVFVKNE